MDISFLEGLFFDAERSVMLRSFFRFIHLLFTQRFLIVSMAKREIASRYVGSFLGVVWNFIHPLVFIFVFWFVFSVGFKAKPMNDVPFVVWLSAGMAPWFVFSDIVTGSVSSVVFNSNLIKKTVFNSEILPVVKILSSLFTHLVFLVVLLGLILFQRMPLSVYFFQCIYYFFCMAVLALGLGWATSALNVFIRDTSQMVGVVMQVGFWGTPIFWDINMMPAHIQKILKFNPVYYIVLGYRDSFISFTPFWERPLYTLYFWIIALTIFVLGAAVFQRLKPQFADVL